MRVEAVGICGSDLHWWAEGGIGDAGLASPLVLGHEFAGTVVEGPLVGRLVAADPSIPCGACDRCRAGDQNLCPTVRHAGHGATDGALRELIAWPDRCLFPVPDGMSATDAALLEPLAVALHLLGLGRVREGLTVGVLGCGPIGLCAVQAARELCASRIVATDRLPHRLAAATAMGATDVVLVGPGAAASAAPAILDAAGSTGLDVVVEIAGDPGAVEDAVAAARPGGTVVIGGIPADDRTSFSASAARRKGLTIRIARRLRGTYPRAIALVEGGAIDLRSLVTATYPLTAAAEAFRVAEARTGIKVIVAPG
jgi:L-iditol 2-dehydrogenase